MNEYKEHPDCPDDDAAILYYVMVDIDTIHDDETAETLETSANMSADMGTEASIHTQTYKSKGLGKELIPSDRMYAMQCL